MGGLNSKEEAAKRACISGNPEELRKAFSGESIFCSCSGHPCDLFKIVSDPRFKANKYDFFGALLQHASGRKQRASANNRAAQKSGGTEVIIDLLPLFELFKEELQKSNNTNAGATPPQFDKIGGGYLEIFVSYFPCDLEGFKYLLDNADVFPLVNPDTNVPNCLLHRLVSHDEGFPLLQEYLSSGQVLARFKNETDTGDENMKHPKLFGNWTPLEIAASRVDTQAVQELCVNNVGGSNYARAFEIMCLDALPAILNRVGGIDVEKKKAEYDQRAVDIFLTFIAQPGAAKQIRTVGSKLYEKHGLNHNIPVDEIRALENFLGARLIWDGLDVHLPIIMLAYGYENLFLNMMHNGCQVLDPRIIQNVGKKQPSSILWRYCDEGNVENVARMLVALRVQEWLIDIDAVDQWNNMTPLQITKQRAAANEGGGGGGGPRAENYNPIKQLLIEAGAVE